MSLVANQADQNQVDRGADNPHRNIITKPVMEAKARLWAVVPLMMMTNYWFQRMWKEGACSCLNIPSQHLPRGNDKNYENLSHDNRSSDCYLPSTKQKFWPLYHDVSWEIIRLQVSYLRKFFSICYDVLRNGLEVSIARSLYGILQQLWSAINKWNAAYS
jgi:hypothetical protein